MRNLSYWAKYHPALARTIIIISRCLLFYIAYFLGKLFYTSIVLSPLWIFFLIALFFIVGATYPEKNSAKNFLKRKTYDLIIACCGFFMVVCLVSELDQPLSVYETATANLLPGDSSLYKYPQAKKLLSQFENGEKTKFSTKEKRIIKKEFNYQLGQYAKAKITGKKATADKIALVLLACIAAVGLLFLVASLACSLSCNGSDAAAIVVVIVGTAAVIWGLIAIINKISRRKSKT